MLENIKRIAESKGRSIYSIEQATGLHNIFRWDSIEPGVEKVKKVADELGVTVDELLKDNPDD